ncbi:MAG: hypothetical protein JWO91_67 [Acidobacteriaceae bacterium]|jgi:hypothetical protein|nr:hypothetical protein [Acidobacteriaceae bacterium]
MLLGEGAVSNGIPLLTRAVLTNENPEFGRALLSDWIPHSVAKQFRLRRALGGAAR